MSNHGFGNHYTPMDNRARVADKNRCNQGNSTGNMSNNNDSQQIQNGLHPGQQPRYPADTDYGSMQITRPTSKTAMLVRSRRAMLEQISCYICKGYLIDATTIDECMDSFCKSCIVIYLRNHNDCPRCGIVMQTTNPYSSIRRDKVLQDIVYKLVPGLYDKEMKRRREFYRGVYSISSDEGDESSSDSLSSRLPPTNDHEKYGLVLHPKPFYKLDDGIDLSLEPHTQGDSSCIYYDNRRQTIVTCFTGNSQQRLIGGDGQLFSKVESGEFRTYLRCPAKLTASQLKRFIAAKFNIYRDDTIHLLYLNESLKDHYSLIDVAYIYDWRGTDHMRLFFIIERDLGKSDDLAEMHRREHRIRQSAGTSAHVVKKVCIDPEPKYYREQNNNIVAANESGRNMRPRLNGANNPAKLAMQMPAKAPILRTTHTSSSPNGLTSQEVSTTRHRTRSATAQNNTNSQQANSIGGSSRPRECKNLKRPADDGQITESSSRLDINRNYVNHITSNQTVQRSGVAGAVKQEQSQRIQSHTSTGSKELIPYVEKTFTTSSSSMSGPSQGSLVTLASFTETRTNQLITATAKSVTGISPSYRNLFQVGGIQSTRQADMIPSRSHPTGDRANESRISPSGQPQVAFSFVTERGITIVRRLNNQCEMGSPNSSTTTSASNNTPRNAVTNRQGSTSSSSNSLDKRDNNSQGPQYSIACSTTTATTTSSSTSSRSSQCNKQPSPVPATSSSPSSSSSSTSSSTLQQSTGGGGGSSLSHLKLDSSRHPKVKPVYKTFVDPTKIKSPNFKKLSYTARH